jgi:DHA1 family tetracycline resistance protein-like MFS transporter
LLLALASAGFLSMLAHDSLPTTAVLYAKYRYQWNERDIGFVLGAVGAAALVVQGGLVGRLVPWLGERKALAAGFLSGAAGMAIYGLAPTGAWFMLGVPGTALYGLSNPALQSLMTREVGPSEQGQLQGANGSMNGIANMAAPILFTQVFALAIGRYGNLKLPGAPFILAAMLLVAAFVVGWRVTQPEETVS